MCLDSATSDIFESGPLKCRSINPSFYQHKIQYSQAKYTQTLLVKTWYSPSIFSKNVIRLANKTLEEVIFESGELYEIQSRIFVDVLATKIKNVMIMRGNLRFLSRPEIQLQRVIFLDIKRNTGNCNMILWKLTNRFINLQNFLLWRWKRVFYKNNCSLNNIEGLRYT